MCAPPFTLLIRTFSCSGVTDHLAKDDHHALAIIRRVVSNLNNDPRVPVTQRPVEEPLYGANDMGSLVPVDTKIQFDVRTILARVLDGSKFDEVC